MWYIASEENINYLAHHGIKGQKWGIRRYQNEDGSLTWEGKKRYGLNEYERVFKDRNVQKYVLDTPNTFSGVLLGRHGKRQRIKDKLVMYRSLKQDWNRYVDEVDAKIRRELIPKSDRRTLSEEELKKRHNEITLMSSEAKERGKQLIKDYYHLH